MKPEFDKLWNFGKPAETETQFLEILQTLENDPDLDYVLQLKNQIARSQGLQRKFEEAHKTLDEVQKN